MVKQLVKPTGWFFSFNWYNGKFSKSEVENALPPILLCQKRDESIFWNHGDFTNLLMVDITDGWGYISWWFFLCFFLSFLPQADGWRGWQPHVFCIGDSTGPPYLPVKQSNLDCSQSVFGSHQATDNNHNKSNRDGKDNNENKSQPRTKTNQAKQVPCARSDWQCLSKTSGFYARFHQITTGWPQQNQIRWVSRQVLGRCDRRYSSDFCGRGGAPWRLFWDAFGWKNMGYFHGRIDGIYQFIEMSYRISLGFYRCIPASERTEPWKKTS